ncbi:DUF4435 domain-containing protein [Wenyingzhuangia aestuarii]|uniref:DUF4435 domain-containing protein n=1 Tax=Wenyingzhuangia aestuarii TaxID=1647582 RepID=UPI00143969DF|nr:DUF4435 domain-containing protein [Wenyingzhuangia aestuarii]NJB84186.1 hypothetical protein [Wenyingzhuangia aestuarii]
MEEITKENIQNTMNNSISVVFHKFSNSCKDENNNKIFCFYEGKDAPYYSSRIEKYFNDEYLNFKCKNKSNVLKIYDKIKHKKDEYILAFFIDNDFDDKVANSDIYETPTYSIENFYCHEDCLKKILRNEFYLNDGDSEFISILDLYKNELIQYQESIMLFNSWYRSLIIKKRTEKLESTGVSLDDKLPSSLFKVNIGGINKTYTLENIKNKYSNAINVTELEVENSNTYLRNHNLTEILRGKYLIHFLINFCEYLTNDSKENKIYIKDNIQFNTNKNIILSHFSNYAYTPTCLESYIETRSFQRTA